MGSLAAEGTALASKGGGQGERRRGKEMKVRRSEGRIKEASEVFIGLRKIRKKKIAHKAEGNDGNGPCKQSRLL